MPIQRVFAHAVGPFDELDLDLSDGAGQAHLGPHILCGVNGSGKSTALRTIAWCLDQHRRGFDLEEWARFLKGRLDSHVAVQIDGGRCQLRSLSRDADGTGDPGSINSWLASLRVQPESFAVYDEVESVLRPDLRLFDSHCYNTAEMDALGCIASYTPRLPLRQLDQPPSSATVNSLERSLSFGATVSNDEVQGWWVNAFAIQQYVKAGKPWEQYERGSTKHLRDALIAILGKDVEPDVDVDPASGRLQPRVRFRGQSLNFSQLPAGFNSTIALIADYLMRRAAHPWVKGQETEQPGVLLIDEIETHLHPSWQRKILRALRDAFPNTQIIVATHSPFVISSCPGARIHVLDLSEKGRAIARAPMDSPIGHSIAANIKDIFGVSSDYDEDTEQLLNQWNQLKRKQEANRLTAAEQSALKELAVRLGARSEELSLLVGEFPQVSDSVITEILQR